VTDALADAETLRLVARDALKGGYKRSDIGKASKRGDYAVKFAVHVLEGSADWWAVVAARAAFAACPGLR
jgi:hypothetical protein